MADAKKTRAYKSNATEDEDRIIRGLTPIEPGMKEYKEAQKLLVDAKARRERLVQEERSASRVAYAEKFERLSLEKGMDVTAKAEGKNHQTLRLKYVLMSRPLVYQMTNEQDLRATLKREGFTTVILTDAYDSTWSFDL